MGARLRERGHQLGLSQAEIARRLKISPERYGNYVRDEREPDLAMIRKFCEALRTTPDWLFGFGDDEHPIDAVAAPMLPDIMSNPVVIGSAEFTAVGRYDASFSAGAGSLLEEEPEPLGYHLIERSWLETVTRAAPEQLAVVRVDGDSMERTLFDNDWLLVDRTQTRFTRAGLYALAVGDMAWIKRLNLDLEARRIQIISDNTAYPMQRLPEEEIRLIGRVVSLVLRRIP